MTAQDLIEHQAALWREFSPKWTASLNRRATIEQLMFDAANGKCPMPDSAELRAWALKLGTPEEAELRITLRPATFDETLAAYERCSQRFGELWERCQGKGWPKAESDEFEHIRDERLPELRAKLRALASTESREAAFHQAVAPLLPKRVQGRVMGAYREVHNIGEQQ
jgi:hypothetical protein